MKFGLELPDWAVVTAERAAHIGRVADTLRGWAGAMGVSAAAARRWERAALLHDALRDAPPELLARYTPQDGWPAKIWHGPAAAAAAANTGESDAGVLQAVCYHSIGFAGWDDCGRMLFLADYLEPGRAHDRAALDALAARVPGDLGGVLRDVTARRIRWLLTHDRPVRHETLELWNSLAAAASSS